MNLLLDSHALIWWFSDDPRLSERASSAIDNAANVLWISSVAAYEIVYKQNLGRLPRFPEELPRRLRREGIDVLPVSLEHALAAARLPGPHRDPWDRIMIAQALVEDLTVVTVDRVFTEYGVPVLW